MICLFTINISCQKKNVVSNSSKSTIDTLYEPPKSLYFDNDNIKDEVKVQAKKTDDLSSFILSVQLSSLNRTIEIPIFNNSILYNNIEEDYFLSDPINKDKIIELRVDYADQITNPNIFGEKKNLIEKIKIRFDPKNKKIQVIGYDLSYSKDNRNKYIKSFNFITGKYYSSCYFDNKKKNTSGWASELKNIYTENWNRDFLNKLMLYGNDVE